VDLKNSDVKNVEKDGQIKGLKLHNIFEEKYSKNG